MVKLTQAENEVHLELTIVCIGYTYPNLGASTNKNVIGKQVYSVKTGRHEITLGR